MSEALVRTLAAWLVETPVVVASVTDTRGATPRKSRSHMLIRAADVGVETFESIGGGEAESRVIASAQALLHTDQDHDALTIDLDGTAGAAGICGGRMQIALQRWCGEADATRAALLAARLGGGESIALGRDASRAASSPLAVQPDDRLLIVGGGHCGLALHQLAHYLDFDLCVFDERDAYANAARFPGALTLSGDFSNLQSALDTHRRVLAVLLSRDFHTDLATLEQLADRPPAFIGMMGSARRVHEVRRALEQRLPSVQGLDFERIHAPIGLDICAHTPHEIAVSVLAELIAWRAKHPLQSERTRL